MNSSADDPSEKLPDKTSDEALERRLAQLVPRVLSEDLLADLRSSSPDQLSATGASVENDPSRTELLVAGESFQSVRRFLPFTIAALITVSGVALVHFLTGSAVDSPIASGGIVAAPVSGNLFDRMVPISTESSVQEIESSGDLVAVAGHGPMQPVVLRYEISECWVDPLTNTSVQVIRPREELAFRQVPTF